MSVTWSGTFCVCVDDMFEHLRLAGDIDIIAFL